MRILMILSPEVAAAEDANPAIALEWAALPYYTFLDAGIEVVLANSAAEWDRALAGDYFAVLAQYPSTSGRIASRNSRHTSSMISGGRSLG